MISNMVRRIEGSGVSWMVLWFEKKIAAACIAVMLLNIAAVVAAEECNKRVKKKRQNRKNWEPEILAAE